MSGMGRKRLVSTTIVSDDESGAVLVEVTVVMTIMLVFLLGSIEFLFVFYQWNAAAKAVQIGSALMKEGPGVFIRLQQELSAARTAQ